VTPLGDLAAEIASIPAPTFAEERRIAWLERRLDGLPGQRHRDVVGNLVWTWGEGRPRLLLLAHVDTVFGPRTELTFRQEGDLLIGPGIGDNAAAVAVTVEVVSELLRTDVAPGAVAFTVGEEGLGNLRGARAACEALRPARAIAVEGHGLEKIIVDCVGSVRARLRVTGPGGHSWADRGGPSAVHEILAIGTTLARRGTPELPFNVGTISGGRSVNAIADEAELLLDVRSIEQLELDGIEQELLSRSVEPPLHLQVEIVGRRPAGRLDRTDPMLATIQAVRDGLELPDTLADGSTDANAAIALDIPALTLGVANGSGMHTLGESIEVSSLEKGRAQLSMVLAEILA
jgi:acetylornithine deacetylase/succinyl-diaminopimelate desuccinylase-like protein